MSQANRAGTGPTLVNVKNGRKFHVKGSVVFVVVESMDLPPRGPSVVHGLKPSRVSSLDHLIASKMFLMSSSVLVKCAVAGMARIHTTPISCHSSLFVYYRIRASKLYG